MDATTNTFPTSRLTPARAHQIDSGVPRRGDFECLSCGYRVSVWRALPRCPMCGAAEWAAAAHRFMRAYASRRS
jgi:rubrerythrin